MCALFGIGEVGPSGAVGASDGAPSCRSDGRGISGGVVVKAVIVAERHMKVALPSSVDAGASPAPGHPATGQAKTVGAAWANRVDSTRNSTRNAENADDFVDRCGRAS